MVSVYEKTQFEAMQQNSNLVQQNSNLSQQNSNIVFTYHSEGKKPIYQDTLIQK
jgi:hypothetical protein